MNIEKALRNYLKCKGPKVSDKDFLTSIEDTNKDIIDVLFSLINDEIDSIDEKKELDRVVEVIRLLGLAIANGEDLDRNKLARKIKKLNEKMDRIIEEGKKKFNNRKKINSEFNKVRRALENLGLINEEEDSKQFSFMRFLIDDARSVTYLEYTFKKIPSLVNVKDKEDIPLFRHLIMRYISSIVEYDEESILYFKNLITLVKSQGNFVLTEQEKRKCLEEIYKVINRLSTTKKEFKKNSKKVELLGRLSEYIKVDGKEKKDVESVASKYNIHVFFDQDIIDKAKLVRKPKEGEMTEREYVDDYTISIDGPSAIEIDDALTCKRLPNGNYLLGVHIASVLAYFDYSSDIVQEAIGRAQSIYLSCKYQQKKDDYESVIPLFPYSFSADKASLKEGEPRFARSYFFEIDKDGNVVNERFAKTIIRNRRQLTYQEANTIIENGCDDESLNETVSNLLEVAKRLDKRFTVDSLYEMIKENTEGFSDLRLGGSMSENIVYRAMLLTGQRVAEFFARNNYPLIYRVHSVDEENNKKIRAMIESLNKTYGTDSFKNLYQLIEGIYPRGWYALEGRHSGLGLEHYCHCTSSLRRASDIIVEHALEVCYDKEPTEEELEKLKEEIVSKIIEINSKQSVTEFFIKEYRKKNRH